MAHSCALVEDRSLAEAIEARNLQAGRPTKFTIDIAAEFIQRLSEGESISSIARSDNMPSLQTFYSWRERHPNFQKAWTRARQLSGESAAGLLLESCHNLLNHGAEMTSVQVKAHGMAHRGLQFIAERHSPDVYQETKRVQVDHTHGVADRLARARTIDGEAVRVDED